MSEWRRVKVAEIAAPTKGAIAIGPFGSAIKADQYSSTGVPVVRGQNIRAGKDLDTRDLVFVPEELAVKLKRSMVHEGDLVFPHRGAIGSVGLVAGQSFLLSSSMMKLTVDRTKADPAFILYYFRGPGHRELMIRASTVGTPGIAQPLSSLRDIDLNLPPVALQRAIANVLSVLDDKIAANTKLATTAEALLRLEFRRLGIDREPAVDKAIILQDLIHLNPARPKPNEENPVYVDMARLPTAGFAISRWTRRPPSGGVRFANGDTVMARITPCLENGKVGYIDFLGSDEVGIGSTEYIVMRSREDAGVPLQLAYFLARSPRFHSYAIQQMVGTSGRQRVGAKDLNGFRLTAPDAGELARFGAIAGPLFRRVRAATDESTRLAATRDAILPALISGRLTVRGAETTVESAVDGGDVEPETLATGTLW